MRTGTDFIDRPILGEQAKVYTLDQSTKTKNGSGYDFTAQTPHTTLAEIDPSLDVLRKQFDWLEYVFDPDSTGTLSVAVYVDRVLVTTLSFDATLARQRQRIGAQGYTISLIESDDADLLDSDPLIFGRFLGFQKIDDDPRT